VPSTEPHEDWHLIVLLASKERLQFRTVCQVAPPYPFDLSAGYFGSLQ
jgi:hypothetical protein